MTTRRRLLLAAAALPAFGIARAQRRPLTIVVGFAPGGGADIVARQLAANFEHPDFNVVLVQNRPGAGGRIAVDAVKAAAPDGHTLLLTPGSILTIYPHVYSQLSYDPIKDLVPITSLTSVPYSLSIGAKLQKDVGNLEQFAQWCRDNPDASFYGSPGEGTTPHFVGAILAKELGIQFRHVAYRGGTPALQDVIGGQIASSINVVSEVVPLAKAQKVQVLGVSSPQPISQLPQVPTFAQQGLPSLTSEEWFGLLAPAGTPAHLVNSINAAAHKAFARAKVQNTLGEMSFAVNLSSPDAFGTRLADDLGRWSGVVKSTGFKIDN